MLGHSSPPSMPQQRLLPTIKIADAQLEADCTQKGISTTEVEEEGTLLRPPPPPRGMDSKDWDSQPLPIRKALMACTCTTEVEEEGNLLCPPPPRVARWRLRGRATYYAPRPLHVAGNARHGTTHCCTYARPLWPVRATRNSGPARRRGARPSGRYHADALV